MLYNYIYVPDEGQKPKTAVQGLHLLSFSILHLILCMDNLGGFSLPIVVNNLLMHINVTDQFSHIHGLRSWCVLHSIHHTKKRQCTIIINHKI